MKKRKKILDLVYSSSKYMGKHVVVIAGKIYSAATGAAASKLLEKLIKKYPKATPTITYVPRADALILFINED